MNFKILSIQKQFGRYRLCDNVISKFKAKLTIILLFYEMLNRGPDTELAVPFAFLVVVLNFHMGPPDQIIIRNRPPRIRRIKEGCEERRC